MNVTVLRQQAHQRMPWRNGGGVTSEVARSPSEGRDADFDWRVSFAEVDQSGEFSSFPGVDRTIILVDGPAMVLDFPDRRHVLNAHQAFAFDGAATVHCTVTAPTRDLNVMVRRDRAVATVDVLQIDGYFRSTAEPQRPQPTYSWWPCSKAP
jgi:environmental stress-induced protein Ves